MVNATSEVSNYYESNGKKQLDEKEKQAILEEKKNLISNATVEKKIELKQQDQTATTQDSSMEAKNQVTTSSKLTHTASYHLC